MALIFFLFLIFDKIAFICYLSQNSDVVQSGSPDQQLLISVLVALVPVVVAFSFIVFLLYRQRREVHFRQVELTYKLDKAELEMKALRAQVNPHFIFNCLNSILHFIHQNKSELAEKYLTKFSRLIRLVLENSTNAMVPLLDDLEALDLYIQLEQLRLNHSFDYIIDTSNVDCNNIYIPPLLIQPFVENSIWHGLANMQEKGNLIIRINHDGELLKCLIEDNGNTAPQRKQFNDNQKSKSMGLDLIQQRLNLFKGKHNLDYYFKIEDRSEETEGLTGKCIELILPYESE